MAAKTIKTITPPVEAPQTDGSFAPPSADHIEIMANTRQQDGFGSLFGDKEDKTPQNPNEQVVETQKTPDNKPQDALLEDNIAAPDKIEDTQNISESIPSGLDSEDFNLDDPIPLQTKQKEFGSDSEAKMMSLEGAERETFAQAEVKVIGKKLKLLEPQFIESQAKIKDLEQQLKEAQSKQPIDRSSFLQHESVTPLMNRLESEFDVVVTAFDSEKDVLSFQSRTPDLVKQYLNASSTGSFAEKKAAVNAMRENIEGDFGYDQSVKIMDFLARNAKSFAEVENKLDDLYSKATSGSLSVGYEDYIKKTSEMVKEVDSMTLIPDDMIAQKPDSPEAIVVDLIKSNPQVKARYESIRNSLIESVNGLRPLSQSEIDILTQRGENIKDYEKKRKSNAKANTSKLISAAAQGILLRSFVPEWRSKALKIESQDSEASALSGIKGKTVTQEKEEPPSGFDALFKKKNLF